MNRTTRFGLLGLLLLSAAACDKVTAGNVGIKVNLLGSEKGVQQEVVGVGRYWIGMNEELYIFPTFTQNEVWTAENSEAIQFQTKEGMTVNADIGIAYHIEEPQVPAVFQKYRKGVEELTDIVLRNAVQDAFSKQASTLAVDAVYGEGKTALINSVLVDLQRSYNESSGVVIESLSWRSEVRVPDTVKVAIDAKIGADQQAAQRRNEVASAKADADKAIEEARGKAESVNLATAAEASRISAIAAAQAAANRELSASLTPELLRSQEIETWDGVLPTYFLGGGDSQVPFILNTPTVAAE